MNLAVGYLRVSTGRQTLGIEAQRRAVDRFAHECGYSLIGDRYYEEVESGSRDDRPQLARVLDLCRVYDATLIVARLDRLSRDAAFLLALRKENISIRFVDLPQADEFTVAILAVVAEHERRLISRRTKEALAVRKAQGVKLGGYRGGTISSKASERSAQVRKTKAVQRARVTLAQVRGWQSKTPTEVADALNEQGIPTASGSGEWTADKARAAMKHLESIE